MQGITGYYMTELITFIKNLLLFILAIPITLIFLFMFCVAWIVVSVFVAVSRLFFYFTPLDNKPANGINGHTKI